jgi:hypothetical protein
MKHQHITAVALLVAAPVVAQDAPCDGCEAVYPEGQTVQLHAVPEPGHVFVGWSGDPDCADGWVTMTGNVDCEAQFEQEAVPPVPNQRLLASDIQHLGSFDLPPRQGPGKHESWGWWNGGLSYAGDCLGRPDPSPNDGLPGCIIAPNRLYDPSGDNVPENREQWVGVFDAVPGGQQAQTVVPMWSIFGTYPMDAHSDIFNGSTVRMNDLLYDPDHPGGCRIWWVFHNWYSEGMEESDPWLGYSSCDPSNPNPQGMWSSPVVIDELGHSVFRPNNMGRHISKLPADVAQQYFGGHRYVLGASKGHGSRGSSAGPSLGVMDFPPANGVGLAYYPHANGFCQWYQDCYFPGATQSQNFEGGDYVRGSGRQAMVELSRMPEVDLNFYPNNVTDTPYHQGNPNYPPPGTPLVWYGKPECPDDGSDPHTNWPSYRERSRDGSMMPHDCNVWTQCPKGKGPQGRNYVVRLQLYDVDELGSAYRGAVKPWFVLPYDAVDLGWSAVEPCAGIRGSTFDEQNGVLYLGTGSKTPRIHAYRIGGDTPPPDPCGNGVCEPGEDWQSCPADCEPPPDPCGDGFCDPTIGEDYDSCPADCEPPPDPCGDGMCDYLGLGEDHNTCPDDCPPVEPCPPPLVPVLVIDQQGTAATVECRVQ